MVFVTKDVRSAIFVNDSSFHHYAPGLKRPPVDQYISPRRQRLLPQIGIHRSKVGTMICNHAIPVKTAIQTFLARAAVYRPQPWAANVTLRL
jgi:hypothetical protein